VIHLTKYCPICNRSSDEIRFIGSFCEKCTIDRIKKKIPTNIKILQCRFCKRIKEGQTFSKISNKSIARAIKLGLKLPGEVKVKGFDDEQINSYITDEVDNEKVEFPMQFAYKIAHETCQRCYRISSGYYEAVVQLRGNPEKIKNLIQKITKYVERREGFIARTEKVALGETDLYISDKLMTNEFFHDYKLKPTRSFRLYGMKRGKKLYRNTYSLHL